jgi:TRAP-type C4-dicarboxylate transport system substrate-binding protein
MNFVSLSVVLAMAVIACSNCFAADPVVIRMGNVLSTKQNVMPGHMTSVQKHISRKVSENTKGELEWQALEGKRPDIPAFTMPAMVAKGDVIQATNVPAFFFPKVPEMMIQSIPFLFTGAEHSRRFIASEPARWMAEKIEMAYDVKVLGFFLVASDVSITAIRPIVNPEDFNDSILNGFHKTWLPMWTDITPKRIDYISNADAVAGKLITDDIDIEINIGMIQNNHGQKLYKRYKYTTLVPNFYNIFYTAVINHNTWNSLTPFQQDGVMDAVRDAEAASIAYQHDTLMWALQLNQSEGVNIRIQTDSERQAWKAAFQPVMKKAIINSSDNPEETQAIIQEIEDLVSDLKWR